MLIRLLREYSLSLVMQVCSIYFGMFQLFDKLSKRIELDLGLYMHERYSLEC